MTNPPIGEILSTLKGLMEGATLGPWPKPEYHNDVGPDDGGFWEWFEIDGVGKFDAEPDAALIVAAINYLPALISSIEQAEGWRPKLGDPVRMSQAAYPAADWRSDWSDSQMFFAGITATLKGENVWIADHWPIRGMGDITDGFLMADIEPLPAPPPSTKEAEG